MMYRKTLQLKTHEAALVFHIAMNKQKSLYRTTMEQIAFLYKAAKRQNKDALEYLNIINQSIDKFLREAKEKIAIYSRRTEELSKALKSTETPVTFEKACYSSNKLGVRLLSCIESVDEIISLLFILLKTNPIMYGSVYYGLKKSFYLPFLQLFSRICAMKIKTECETQQNFQEENKTILQKKSIQINPIKKAENSCL